LVKAILDIVANEPEAPRLEMSATGSLSEDSSRRGSRDNVDDKAEDIRVVDPHESVWSYDFGASTVSVSHIRQLESLGYFAKGSTCELGEETIQELADNMAIVFEEFFATGLRMPPHLALTKILIKFRVQLHQLALNAFAQLSKYFSAVMSFGGKPSSDGFVKHYELHY
jgi:hypothetical protein